MINPKPSHKKPFYKKVLMTRKNVINNTKCFFFKKKKWKQFIFFSKLKYKFFRRYKYNDPSKVYVTKFASKGNALKKQFKLYLAKVNGLKIVYGGFKKKPFKKLLTLNLKKNLKIRLRKKISNQNLQDVTNTLLNLEKRLDNILFKTKFCHTIKEARQMISHGHIKINNKPKLICGYKLKRGDLVSITKKPSIRQIIRFNIIKSSFWPIPPKFLLINYKTLTIINTTESLENEKMFLPDSLRLDFIKNNAKFK